MDRFFTLIILVSCLTSCSKYRSKDPCAEFDRADLYMLTIIEEANKKYRAHPKFLKAFKMEQVYWVQYRDRHLRVVYPEDWDRHYRKNFGKEVFNSCKCRELLRMTKARIIELRMYLDEDSGDQQECPDME